MLMVFVLAGDGLQVGRAFAQGAAEAETMSVSDLLEQAKVMERDRRFDGAAALYRKALARRPEDDDIRVKLARIESWQGRYDEAATLYRDVLTRHPVDLDVRVALARVLSWQKQFGEAERLYRDVLEEVPTHLDAKQGLADTLVWANRPAEALPLYEEVYRVTRDVELGQRIDAVKVELQAASQRALRIELGERVVKARHLAWQKQYDEAIETYRAVLRQDSTHLEAKQGLADTYYWSGRYAEALSLYQEIYAETKDPELPVRIQAVQAELSLSTRAVVKRGAGGVAIPFRDYLKVGYSHYAYTNRVPDERDWLIEAAKPIGEMTLIGRIEPQNRFGLHDTPISAELYSPLWRGAWGYVAGTGAIDAQFVPKWSMGGEVFQGVGAVTPSLRFLEVSFGYRRMEFKTAGIDLLVPGLTIYFPWNLWLTEKISYVPDQGSMTLSSQLTWRPQDRLQFFVSGGYGTSGERIVSVQDFTRVRSVIWQGGTIFPITERFSGEVSAYYEDRGFLYVRRGATFNLIWHW